MRLLWFKTTPKVFGDCEDKNEDVFLVKSPRENITRFVMCDGATASFAARVWASMLVKSFANVQQSSDKDRVYNAAKEYENRFSPTAMMGNDHFVIQAFKRGSSSTLLLIVQNSENRSLLHVTAVGDSCCFIVDKNYRILRSFPLVEPKSFSTSTPLITVTFEGLRQLFDERTSSYYWKRINIDTKTHSSKKIICATDAVAKWIVAHKESPRSISRLVRVVKSKKCEEFTKFIECERKRKMIPVDDSSVAILEI